MFYSIFQEIIPEYEQKSNKNSNDFRIVYNASEEKGTPKTEKKNESVKLLHNMSSGLGTTTDSKGKNVTPFYLMGNQIEKNTRLHESQEW